MADERGIFPPDTGALTQEYWVDFKESNRRRFTPANTGFKGWTGTGATLFAA